MSDVRSQTVDEFLGPLANVGARARDVRDQSVDEFLGPTAFYEGKLTGSTWDSFFSENNFRKKFDKAYDEAFDTSPSFMDRKANDTLDENGKILYKGKSITDHLRDVGVFPKAAGEAANVIKNFNESLMRGTVGLAEYAMRAAYATVRGAAATADSGDPRRFLIAPVGAAAASLFEMAPAGHFTGLPTVPVRTGRPTGIGGQVFDQVKQGMDRLGFRADPSAVIDEMLHLQDIESPHPSYAKAQEALAADQEARGAGPNRQVLGEMPEAPDPIQLQREQLQRTIRGNDIQIQQLRELGRPFEAPGAVVRLETENRRAQEQLDALGPENRPGIPRQEADTPVTQLDQLLEERRTLQKWLDENTGVPPQIRVGGVDISGNVPLHEAGAEYAREAEAPTGQRAAQSALEKQIRDHLTDLDERIDALVPKASEARRARDPAIAYTFESPIYADADFGLPPRGEPAMRGAPIPDVEPVTIIPTSTQTVQAGVSPEITQLRQRRPTIAREVYQNLIDVGRPDAEARGLAAVVQAHYTSRAARFEGRLGTARELYDADMLPIERVRSRAVATKGMLDFIEGVIKFYKNADASTGIHELGHLWLEELLLDAKHAMAPADLKADIETARKFMGMKEGQDRPTREQHEKFAEGFERYFRMGVAPDPKLANIFTKFAVWLGDIYRTIRQMNLPVSPEMAGVYDRLLKTPKTEVFIEPEQAGRPGFADAHEAMALDLPPEKALAGAEAINAERSDVSSVLRAEIDAGRQRVRAAARAGRSTVESGEGGDIVPERASRDVRPEPARAADVAPDAEKRSSGTSPEIESPTVTDPGKPAARSGGRYVDKAGNIRLDLLDAPEDVENAIRSAAEYNDGYGRERRGVVTDADILELATRLGLDPAFLDAKKIGDAFNAQEIVAARLLLRQSEISVRQAMKAVNEGGDPLDLAKAIAQNEMIQGKVAQATAEWGRAGRAFHSLRQLIDSDALSQFLKDNKGDFGRTYDQLLQMAKYGEFMTGEGQLNNFARTTHGSRWPILYYYLNSLLSGSITHSIYAIGNELRAVVGTPLETAFAATSGSAKAGVAAMLGREAPADRVYWGQVMASYYGLGKGSIEAWRAMKIAFQTGTQVTLPGIQPFIPSIPITTKGVGTGVGQMLKGAATADIREIGAGLVQSYGLPYRSVAAIHSYGAMLHYYQGLYIRATGKALAEGRSGDSLRGRIAELTRNPSDADMEMAFNLKGAVMPDMPEVVQDWAHIASDSAAEAMTKMYMRVYDYHSPLAQTIRGLHNNPVTAMLVPFVKVGAEILRENWVRYSPLGYIKFPGMPEHVTRSQLLGRNGGAVQDMARGKVALGVSLMSGGALLNALGTIDGAGPSDKAENEMWQADGHLPYSLRLGAGVRIPLNGLPVIGSHLTFGADMYAGAMTFTKPDDPKHEIYQQIAKNYIHAFAHALFEEGFFRDLADLGSVVHEPDRYLGHFLMNMANNFTPWGIGLGQVNRFGFDPYSKDVHGFDVTAILDSFRRAIPGASYGVPNRLDVFGNPIPSRSSWRAHFAEYNNDPVVQMIDHLQMGISKPDRSIEGVELTTREYEHFSSVAGKLTYRLLQPLATPEFQRAPPGIQRKMIHDQVLRAHDLARKQVTAESMHQNPYDNLATKAVAMKLQLMQPAH